MHVRILLIVWFITSSATAGEWWQFRGPGGEGHTVSDHLPLTWGGLLDPPVWQTPLPGRGWSSPIVIGNRIWLTSAEQTALSEQQQVEKLQSRPYGVDEFQAHDAISLLAIEVDATSGRVLRSIELFTHDDPAPIHVINSYASPTPVTDGSRLYCHFGSLGTVCIALEDGRTLWHKQFAVEEITGPGSSPVLSENRLILTCDGADEQYLVALDKLTGEVVWRTDRPPIDADDDKLRRAFSTPLEIEHDGRRQLVAPGAQWIVSYDPASGAELWRVFIGGGHAVVPRPVYRDGVVYVCTGYPEHELLAIRVDGQGDVTSSHVVWRYDRQVPQLASPILVGDQIYFVSNAGILTCLAADTGELIWRQRLDGTYAASPLAADGKLYFTSQEGVTTVIQSGREYQELAKNKLFGHTMASLAVYGDALLIRTESALYLVRDEGRDSRD